MKRYICLISLFVLVLYSSALAESVDIKGWQKIKWGMSKSEISNLYKLSSNQDKEIILKEPFYIDQQAFSVILSFDDRNIIEAVILRPDKSINDIMTMNRLMELLTNKYGEISRDQDNELLYTVFWMKKSGKIRLDYVSLLSSLAFSYMPKPKALDKL